MYGPDKVDKKMKYWGCPHCNATGVAPKLIKAKFSKFKDPNAKLNWPGLTRPQRKPRSTKKKRRAMAFFQRQGRTERRVPEAATGDRSATLMEYDRHAVLARRPPLWGGKVINNKIHGMNLAGSILEAPGSCARTAPFHHDSKSYYSSF